MLAYPPEMENMFMKQLAYVFLGVLALGITPAFATSKMHNGDFVTVTNRSSGTDSSQTNLTQMPVKGYPSPAEILKIEEENKRKAGTSNLINPAVEPSREAKTHEEKRKEKNVKHVYKGTPDIELKRQIQDPRIDDGYVQGLIQQRSY